MKKKFVLVLASLLTFVSSMPIYANSSITQIPSSSIIEPRAYPEKATGRVITDKFNSSEKYVYLAAFTKFLTSKLSAVWSKAGAVGSVAETMLLAIAASEDTVYYTGTAKEYYVYDFEGNVIAYKYYYTLKAYNDSTRKDLIKSVSTVKQSVSPMSITDMM